MPPFLAEMSYLAHPFSSESRETISHSHTYNLPFVRLFVWLRSVHLIPTSSRSAAVPSDKREKPRESVFSSIDTSLDFELRDLEFDSHRYYFTCLFTPLSLIPFQVCTSSSSFLHTKEKKREKNWDSWGGVLGESAMDGRWGVCLSLQSKHFFA